MIVPTAGFLTSGVGIHEDKLISFELALRHAGIHPFNLVPVSSIWPPGCRALTREEGLRLMQRGQVAFCVLARISTNTSNEIGAAIGRARYDDRHRGYLSEHALVGPGANETGREAERLATLMLHSLNDVNPQVIYTDSAMGLVDNPPDSRGKCKWATAIAALVFCAYR